MVEARLMISEEALAAALIGSRVARMCAQYGETTTPTKAASILGVGRTTIYSMLEDGRLRRLEDGRIDVESIAHYLEDPRFHDQDARLRKRYRSRLRAV